MKIFTMFMFILFSTHLFAEQIVLQSGQSILVDGNVISCAGAQRPTPQEDVLTMRVQQYSVDISCDEVARIINNSTQPRNLAFIQAQCSDYRMMSATLTVKAKGMRAGEVARLRAVHIDEKDAHRFIDVMGSLRSETLSITARAERVSEDPYFRNIMVEIRKF